METFQVVTDNFITTPQRTQSGVSAVLPTVRQAQVSSLFIDLRPDLWILSITFIWTPGKTYTTLGPSAATSPDFFLPQNINKRTSEFDAVGILPRALRDLFIQLEKKRLSSISGIESNGGMEVGLQAAKESSKTKRKKQPFEYTVKLQFLELYGEDIRDVSCAKRAAAKLDVLLKYLIPILNPACSRIAAVDG